MAEYEVIFPTTSNTIGGHFKYLLQYVHPDPRGNDPFGLHSLKLTARTRKSMVGSDEIPFAVSFRECDIVDGR